MPVSPNSSHHSAWTSGWSIADITRIKTIELHPEAQRAIAQSWQGMTRFLNHSSFDDFNNRFLESLRSFYTLYTCYVCHFFVILKLFFYPFLPSIIIISFYFTHGYF
ncbi:hypothetical protein IQ226_17875 [Dolichospermum sp. LEGE 00240]|jgi:hypothetical protein|uniref:hypothetical protein n=1 Tax=Dolichospermum sp. LEGE 00240 TaxID=1828603 RepID=UPI0018829C2A|nr:hypothetical protein [Dolichospermum sp. LEGE 00240]MDM3846559.1 hypothetical protein [Aphanizomenon gracile PMC638.10]MDM3848652.1 hypothetical protein [Aphanizomenon gracile PMC627.10]MDM3857699.1 hypothetical protein [Aphanizomenon gracile PMC649.10]MDM3861110.1 hypothetical protein [Aphanizomenon gracile PMC644.10]MBE9250960.1 hypothetical protein [Dolichospermum sp. LEGE 00240]